MYVVIEKTQDSFLQMEYHIINENQMKQFILDKDCSDMISSENFAKEDFRENLENALNESSEDKEYQVVHIWLH